MTPPARSRLASETDSAGFDAHWPIFSIAFLPLCFLYVWLRVQPALEYQQSCPEFLLGGSFVRAYLAYPGGLASYAAAFLAQLNIQNWLGAAVFSLLCGVIIILFRRLARVFFNLRADLLALVIPFLLLVLKDRYHAQVLLLALGIILTLLFCAAVASIPETRRFFAPATCWVAAPVLFYLAGAWALAVFAVICCLEEMLCRKSIVGAGLCLASLLVAPLWLLCEHNWEVLQILNPWKNRLALAVAGAAYGCMPVLIVTASLWRFLVHAPEQKPASGHKTHPGHAASERKPASARSRGLLLKIPAFGAACAMVWFALDVPAKARAQVHYYTAMGEYDKVPPIAAGIRREDLDPATEIRLQSALYHTGRLCEELFSFRNQSSWTMLPGLSVGIEACRAQSQVLLELGFVSDAEHYAHEALEVEGAKPEVLRLLASVNLLKQRPKAARIFLTVLSQVPFQRSSAAAWLRALPNDPASPDGSALTRIRSCMFTNDLPHDSLPAEPLLRQLLHRNETNRMAFEYLMAHYLTRLQTEKIIEALPAFEFLGYRQLPRHIEEAILLHEKVLNKKIELQGCKIRPETLERFQRFSLDLDRRLDQSDEGRRELTRDFGDTFWYYYLATRGK